VKYFLHMTQASQAATLAPAPIAPGRNFRFGTQLCLKDAQVPVHEQPCGAMVVFKLSTVDDRVKVLDGMGQVVDCGGTQLRFIKVANEAMSSQQGFALETELTNVCMGSTTRAPSMFCARDMPCGASGFECIDGVCVDPRQPTTISDNTAIYIGAGVGGGFFLCLICLVLIAAIVILKTRRKRNPNQQQMAAQQAFAMQQQQQQQMMFMQQQHQMQQMQMQQQQQMHQMQPGYGLQVGFQNSGAVFDPAWGGVPTQATPMRGGDSFTSAASFDQTYPSQRETFGESKRAY
jgi:hypothetical protein